MLHESLPTAKDEKDNVVGRQSGSTRKMNFSPKDHLDIATALDL